MAPVRENLHPGIPRSPWDTERSPAPKAGSCSDRLATMCEAGEMLESGSARLARLGAGVPRTIRRHPLAAFGLLAAVPRLVALGGPPFDLDETWTWYTVHLVQSGRSFWQVLSVGLDGPLFLASNLAIAGVVGAERLPGALRLAAAIAGTLAVPLTFALARRLWGARAALLTGGLAALSPFLIFYSRQARPYALLLLCCVLHAWVCASAAGRRRRLAIAGTAALAMASHAYAIVFLGAFHGLRWVFDRLGRRRDEQRRELGDAAVALAAAAPFFAFVLWRFARLSLPYWRRAALDLPAIWAEQFLCLGSSIGTAPESAAWLNRLVTLLLLAPFVAAVWRRPRAFLDRPLLLLGLAMPLVVALAGAAVGARLLFYPRGFIGATPFLLAGWALSTLEWSIPAWLRHLYAALLLVPFLGSSLAIAVNHPAHAYYRDRNVMPEIVARASALRDRYDVLLVHHWWLAQYVAFFHPEPDRVQGLGMWRRDEAARDGELVAVLRDLAQIPPDARILLLRNDLIATYGDPGDAVLEALRARRPQVDSLSCREAPAIPGESMFCDRLYLFGPESAPAASGDTP